MTVDVAIVDSILSTVVAQRLTLLDVSHVPGLDSLRNTPGVVFDDPDEIEAEGGMQQQEVLQRATVDVRQLLSEAVGSLGYLVTQDERDGFVRLERASAPGGCAFFFLEKPSVPLYVPKIWAKADLCVVVHVDESIGSSYNDSAHALGIHAVRLRDLPKLTDAAIAEVLASVRAADAALPPPGTIEVDTPPPDLDPTKVAEYASTAGADEHFEWAVSMILAPLVPSMFRLGSAYRGLPVPDGLVFETGLLQGAVYDCKSKKSDYYGLEPADADQQNRYLEILERLKKNAQIRPRGILLFTPNVSQETFDDKTQKEFWARIANQGLQLLVIPAVALAHLQRLTSNEGAAFGTFFQKQHLWTALFEQTLPGLASEKEQALIQPDRTRKLRLLTPADLELAWVSAIVQKSPLAHHVGEALKPTDVSRSIKEKVRRPSILKSFFKAAGERRNVTIEDIARATGLTQQSVRYLLLSDAAEDASREEFGDHGVKNIGRLNEEIRTGS